MLACILSQLCNYSSSVYRPTLQWIAIAELPVAILGSSFTGLVKNTSVYIGGGQWYWRATKWKLNTAKWHQLGQSSAPNTTHMKQLKQ